MKYSSDAWFNLDKELVFIGKNVLHGLDALTSDETVLSLWEGERKVAEFKFGGTLQTGESYFGYAGMYFSNHLRFVSDKPCLIRPTIHQEFDPEMKAHGVIME